MNRPLLSGDMALPVMRRAGDAAGVCDGRSFSDSRVGYRLTSVRRGAALRLRSSVGRGLLVESARVPLTVAASPALRIVMAVFDGSVSFLGGACGGQAIVDAGVASLAIAQAKPTSSRAIAVVTTEARLPAAERCR